MNLRHLEILQHALGADQWGTMPKYGADRNYYGTDPYDLDCIELVQMGYMVELPARSWLPDTMFAVTEAGKEAMKNASPLPPKVSAGAKRFEEYRNYSDAFDCTFREWLDIRKTDWYKDMKEGSLR
jgi:hypothetical protein